MIERLEALLAAGQDNALLRLSLGQALLREGRVEDAEAQLRAALAHDPGYSAAWRALGQALDAAARPGEAAETYRRGIEVAEGRGDRQVAREMAVFLKRLEKKQADPDAGRPA